MKFILINGKIYFVFEILCMFNILFKRQINLDCIFDRVENIFSSFQYFSYVSHSLKLHNINLPKCLYCMNSSTFESGITETDEYEN